MKQLSQLETIDLDRIRAEEAPGEVDEILQEIIRRATDRARRELEEESQ